VVKLADFGIAVRFQPEAPRSFMKPAGTKMYAAPETFRGPYGPECDLWSAGAVLYVVLSGTAPFAKDASESSAQPHYHFPSEVWEGISQPAQQLVTLLLNPDATQRITASAALEHPWLQDDARGRSQEFCCLSQPALDLDASLTDCEALRTQGTSTCCDEVGSPDSSTYSEKLGFELEA
jgi:serine/threonine protein kinase